MTAAVRPLSPSSTPCQRTLLANSSQGGVRIGTARPDPRNGLARNGGGRGGHTDSSTPLVHHGHPLCCLVHDSTPPDFVEQPKLAICNKAIYLNDTVGVRVKTGHLWQEVSSTGQGCRAAGEQNLAVNPDQGILPLGRSRLRCGVAVDRHGYGSHECRVVDEGLLGFELPVWLVWSPGRRF